MADPKVGVHEIVRRCGGPAGSACVFTESCTHGTIPWRGAGERRTLFMKFSPRSVSWSDIYFDADRLPWAAELSDRERQILMLGALPRAWARRGPDWRGATLASGKVSALDLPTFTAAVQTATKLDSPKAKAQRALAKTKAVGALSAKRTATT